MKTPEEQAAELTDQKLEKLEREIAKRYISAEKELYKEIHAYFTAIAKDDEIKAAEMASGTITKEEYKQWRMKRMTTGKDFEKLRDKIANRYLKANMESDSLINALTPEIFALNHNYEAYKAEMAVNDGWQ